MVKKDKVWEYRKARKRCFSELMPKMWKLADETIASLERELEASRSVCDSITRRLERRVHELEAELSAWEDWHANSVGFVPTKRLLDKVKELEAANSIRTAFKLEGGGT